MAIVDPHASRGDAAPTANSAPSDDEWGSLMVAGQAGNGGAYRRLLIGMRPWLARYYAQRLPMGMIDDAIQDTLIAVHNKRHTYQPDRPFKAWLCAIARYKWIDRLRAMQRQSTVRLDDELVEPSVGSHESTVTSAHLLENLLARLKPSQTEVIRLVKLKGYSVEDASVMTGQSISLVKVNIHRGLARLSAIVETDLTDD